MDWIDLAIKHGIFKSVSTRIEYLMAQNNMQKLSIMKFDKFFTKEVLTKIDEAMT